jgi:hypothetical protein
VPYSGAVQVFSGLYSTLSSQPAVNGYVFVSSDTGQIFIYNSTLNEWVQQFPVLTGDVSNTLGSTNITLNKVNSNVGTWGNAANYPVITVNSKGLITAVSLESSLANTSTVTLSAPTPTVVGGQVGLGNTTSLSATAGSLSALPSLPALYLEVNINGVFYKIPCYNI